MSEEVLEIAAPQSRIERIFGPQRWWLHITLFLLTVLSTITAGVSWRGGVDTFDIANLGIGVEYSFLILLFLSAHEFGHFIAARLHDVDATLPFYIPFPGAAVGMINFGTFGAVIKTRSKVPSNKAMFDIGVAGPIAGFIVCIGILAIGFARLPGIEYLQAIHPGYPHIQLHPGEFEMGFGRTLLYSLLERIFANPNGYLPPMTEIYHYPMLCVGWFGLFVTSLNLLPVGQLDGGHLTYTLFGKRSHNVLGKITAAFLFLIALPDAIVQYTEGTGYQLPEWAHHITINGGSTWLAWALITTLVIRFRHPETGDESPLDTRRKIIGYLTLAILALSFTPSPFEIG